MVQLDLIESLLSSYAGVEYVISEKVFKTLPQEEKQLWHSHEFEVRTYYRRIRVLKVIIFFKI